MSARSGNAALTGTGRRTREHRGHAGAWKLLKGVHMAKSYSALYDKALSFMKSKVPIIPHGCGKPYNPYRGIVFFDPDTNTFYATNGYELYSLGIPETRMDVNAWESEYMLELQSWEKDDANDSLLIIAGENPTVGMKRDSRIFYDEFAKYKPEDSELYCNPAIIERVAKFFRILDAKALWSHNSRQGFAWAYTTQFRAQVIYMGLRK